MRYAAIPKTVLLKINSKTLKDCQPVYYLYPKSHCQYCIETGKEAQETLPRLFSLINFERGETLRIVEGEESIKVLVDEKNLKKVLDLLPKRIIIKIQEDLAEVNIHLHPEAVNTPGIVLVISTELMLNSVNIYEIMSCVPEMLVFVEEKDLMKAYQTLFELCHKKENNKTKK